MTTSSDVLLRPSWQKGSNMGPKPAQSLQKIWNKKRPWISSLSFLKSLIKVFSFWSKNSATRISELLLLRLVLNVQSADQLSMFLATKQRLWECCKLWAQLFSMAACVKNKALADDLKRALLLKVPKVDPAQVHAFAYWQSCSFLLGVHTYVLEEVAPRLTSTVLEKAAMEDFKVSKGEATRFATAIRDVVKEARPKSKAFKAGEKNWLGPI